MLARSRRRDALLAILVTALAGLLCLGSPAHAAELARRGSGSPNNTFVSTAIMSFMTSLRASWEQGVASAALLETKSAQWSVYSGDNPPPYAASTAKQKGKAGSLSPEMIAIASAAVQTQDSLGRLCMRVTGDESTNEGSALDSASCGEAVLFAAYANGEIYDNGTMSNSRGSYGYAATLQLNYLLNSAPRTKTGAISMRQMVASYWSDGLYMAPPFIALYGLMTGNASLMMTAYEQISLYRDALRIDSGPAQGLLRHIVNGTDPTGSGNDDGAWLTGNGWGSAGICRVIAAFTHASSNMTSQINNLEQWASEIVSAALALGNPLMHNYINDSSTFDDAGGSALVAYSAFRLASLFPRNSYTAQTSKAEQIYQTVQSQLTPAGAMMAPFQVANPLSFTSPVSRSPESMAFMVLLSSARRDYTQGNVTNAGGDGAANSALRAARQSLPFGHSSRWLLAAFYTAFIVYLLP